MPETYNSILACQTPLEEERVEVSEFTRRLSPSQTETKFSGLSESRCGRAGG